MPHDGHTSAQAHSDPQHGHDHEHCHAHDHEGHAGHDHGPGGHVHAVTADSERRVLWAMLLTGGFMLVEVVGGVLSGSLALLADAGHMLTDFGSLALAWFEDEAHPSSSPRRTGGQRWFSRSRQPGPVDLPVCMRHEDF